MNYEGFGRKLTAAQSEYYPVILRQPGFDPRSGNMGFVVDKVALGQFLSEYCGFPCQF
jgi:hypothetical protein